MRQTERESGWVCMHVRKTPCCVCNFLFVHGTKHLKPLQNRQQIQRVAERLNETKKIEREGTREGRIGKRDDNKHGSDFTDAYFINHVNKSW